MTETDFWNLLEEAKTAAGNTKSILQWLERRLLEYPVEDILDFQAWLATFMDRANDERLWAAGKIIARGMSDDGFVYFQCWLIAQGRAVYEAAVAAPDSLADFPYEDVGMFGPSVCLEALLYAGSFALNKKLGKPQYSATAPEFPPGYQIPPGAKPYRTAVKNAGFLRERTDQNVFKAAFPKLVERFGML